MKKEIKIEGMSCNHCVSHVREALIEIGGENVEVSLEKKEAIAYLPSTVNDDAIKEAIEDVGYEVVEII